MKIKIQRKNLNNNVNAKFHKQEKGITLIALIVTIVIMLILAGVTIKLAIDDNGVIGNAKDAKNQYEQAQVNADSGLNDLSSEMKKYLEENRKTSADKPNDDGEKEPKTETVDGVPIPEGFVYVGGTKNSGLVISDNSADKEKYKGQTTVGTDLQGNQFVWIPVENIADYKRTWYTGYDSFSIYSETLPDDEKTSVEQNKGYYIGRYEAGDKESTEAKKLRTATSKTSDTVTIKANQSPYTYVSRNTAKELAENFGIKQNYKNVETKMVSSYAWDTAIAFIQKTVSDYGSSSPQGNYTDTTFTYTDITGASQTKANGDKTLIPTGQTTGVCNIYDMGGNAYEWTTEYSSEDYYHCTGRGGGYYATDCPAGHRGCSSDDAGGHIGFRVTLFL